MKIFIMIMIQSLILGREPDSIPTRRDSLQVEKNIEYLYQFLSEEIARNLGEKLAEDWIINGIGDEIGDGIGDGISNGTIHGIGEGINTEDYEAAFEELLQEYLLLQEYPININSEEVMKLEEMGLLNHFQIESLRQYRRMYGNLLFLNELMMLEDFNEHTIAVIAPIVCFGQSEQEKEWEKVTPGKFATLGKHQLTVNYAQKFNSNEEETAYLGSPMKLQVKYTYHYRQKFRAGVVMEKDAGEPFFFGKITDSLQELVRQYRKPGFDFYGFHLYSSDIALTRKRRHDTKNVLVVKDFVAGDYMLSFGQGLTLWTGMSMGKTAGGSNVMKRAAGIKPKASSGEGKFFRGAATTLKLNDFYATAFYSLRDIDANVSLLDSLDDAEQVSSLLETGYHRTLNELTKRNTLRQQVFGGHLSYSTPQLEVGMTAYHLRLSAPLQLKPSKYNQFYFQGDRLTNVGLDFRWTLRKTAFFGEVAWSDNGAFGGLAGLTMKPAGYLHFTLLYRNYDKRFQNLFNAAFGESSRRQGEEGVYLGLEASPIPRWKLLAYSDFYRFTWLGSQVYSPSWGQEYVLKVEHQISHTAAMQFRWKSKTKMRNSPQNEVFSYYPVFYTKRTASLQISYGISDALVFTNRAEYSRYLIHDGPDSRGYFLSHDLAWKPEGKPYALTFRYALFRSDDYNSHLTVYENDVLGGFSIPALHGSGIRIYLLGRLKLFNVLSLYARAGCLFSEKGPTTDLKVEMVVR